MKVISKKKMGSGKKISKPMKGRSFNGKAYEKQRGKVFGLAKAEDQGKA